MMENLKIAILGFVLFWVSVGPVFGNGDEVVGVFGLSQVSDQTACSIWIPVSAGEKISSFRWFNNDENSVFPEVFAVAGSNEEPARLDQATLVAQGVVGENSDWSELEFYQPITTNSEGLHILFLFPENSGFEFPGQGGGVGFGYKEGQGVTRCWVTADGLEWQPFSSDYQIAGSPVYSANKRAGVLVLEEPEFEEIDIEADAPVDEEGTFKIIQAYPNPFNPETTISFSLVKNSDVRLGIYDVRGALVRSIVVEQLNAGDHQYSWDGRTNSGIRLPSGVYFALLSVNGDASSKRLVMVK